MTKTAVPERRPTGLRMMAQLSLASVCGLAFGFTVYVFVLSMVSGKVLGSRDIVARWATGQLMAHHANPYDGNALLKIERAAGFPVHYGVMYMLNPPWTLPLVYPFGFIGLQAASILWSILQLACLATSVYLLWIMHGRPNNRRHYLGYSFAPALICLIMGQVTILALLGLVLFLRLHRTWPFLAGMSLWLCMLKPHLFLPFGVVLLAWIIVSRSYRLLLGATFSIVATSAIALLLAPMQWSQYLKVLHSPGTQWEFVPCLSVLLRVWISKDTAGLNYVPAVLGCVWALAYFWPRRATWDWTKDGSLLMLVSILVAPYAWLYDQALAIPALLQGAYVTRSRSLLAALALLSVLIELALFGIVWKPQTLYTWTLWSAPAWIVWYLYATAEWSRQAEESSDDAVVHAEQR
jgi:Glycosyltransferase family 87